MRDDDSAARYSGAMAQRSSLRASDADRDQATDRLRKAAAEGRILASELEDRLASALRARTYGDLDAVTADLPGGRVAHVSYPQRAIQRRPAATIAVFVCVTVVAAVVAAVAFAGLVLFWTARVLFEMLFMARHGGAHTRPRHHRPYAAYRNLPSRW
jgi:Flp pilus assembly protein TadB